MNFSDRADARRRDREQREERKEWKRALVAAGCDKSWAGEAMREFGETLSLGESLRDSYNDARAHLSRAIPAIERMLQGMAGYAPAGVGESLRQIVSDLSGVRHPCLIREDDADFQSTFEGLSRMAGQCGEGGVPPILLRSELENVYAVLRDASGWEPPDFFALAYYLRHEDGAALGEMENDQRNAAVLEYARGGFLDEFLEACGRAGIADAARERIAEKTI